MPPSRDAISVRTTRLNNLILSKHSAASGAILKATAAASMRRSVISNACGGALASVAVAEALGREGLLDAFLLLYDECDKEAMKKRDRNIAEFVTKFRPIIEETRQLRVNTEDFTVKTLIGKGYFGNVHLVVERATSDVYAMKKIKKSVVTTSQVKEERDIMSRRCSEWITNLQYAFQDRENLYLIMEFLPGGDLLGLMTRHGPFDEDWARFYLAELTLAIHSLHSMGFVHRDIKPENILIDRFGHIKLADFGNAAALDRDGHVLSLSPVGTPDYIAPELLQTISTYKLTKSTHDVSCDFWSMGIIGYELICEITPFHEDNVHETYSKILSHCEDSHLRQLITFPADLKVSANFKHLIQALLTNPTNRLGYDKVRRHAYFETIKWETLRAQVPPIIPAVNGADDTSNFDDVTRHNKGGRPSTYAKQTQQQLTLPQIKAHDFSGKDLPFIGYSFVHMETTPNGGGGGDDCMLHDARVAKLNGQIKDMQVKLKERADEIAQLQQTLLRAEQAAKQSDTRSKILHDAKEEILKMKNTIKEKTSELAACRTQIKTLQSAIKVEEEMSQKKEATITDLLRLNRQKYEEAKIASEQRYEKLISEKKHELAAILQKLDAREIDLTARSEQCAHLQEKMENYKEMLRQFKEQAHADNADFERNKTQLSDTYEEKLLELRTKLRQEKDAVSRVTLQLRDARNALDVSAHTTQLAREAAEATQRNHDQLLQRLNGEIAANNELHTRNAQLEQQLAEAQLESQRLDRELQVAECGKKLAESPLAVQATPYGTAAGSLTELHDIEEQLRAELAAARDNEDAQRTRADHLQANVEKLEQQLMEHLNSGQALVAVSPSKATPHPAPRQAAAATTTSGGAVGDMLERQNERLEDKLATVREQMIVERQAARSANLALWKLEKQLEESLAAKRLTERRMELTEERSKKALAEREEALRQCQATQAETRRRDDRIEELKEELGAAKRNVHKEHRMWEKAEQERMQAKSEIIEHIASVHKLEEHNGDLRQKLQLAQQLADSLGLDHKRLLRELNEERERVAAAVDSVTAGQIQLKNLQDNYERLKYACTITDSQLTEVEGMLEAEQRRGQAQQAKLDQLYEGVRQRDETIGQLQQTLSAEQAQGRSAEARIRALSVDKDEYKAQQQDLQRRLIGQQQQLLKQTNTLFATQERVEVLTSEAAHLQALHENCERELTLLKEENARILCDLFGAKEETHRLQADLKEALASVADWQADVDELQGVLAEKENFYLQRDIKSEATLSQHKKLIDYLQLKVEDLSAQHKKKKTLADKLFGNSSSSANSAAKKENISPNAVESSILYRTLQEELRREKQRSKTLQEQIENLNVVGNASTTTMMPRQALQSRANTATREAVSGDCTSPRKPHTMATAPRTVEASSKYDHHHRFELTLQEAQQPGGDTTATCLACAKSIVAGAPHWKCRQCKGQAHRKCRSDVLAGCGVITVKSGALADNNADDDAATTATDDANSMGKYSYEGKVDAPGNDADTPPASRATGGGATLVLSTAERVDVPATLEVNCAYEIEEGRILLLGCNTGLYAFHHHSDHLVHIAGIDSVNCITISLPLAKAIMVGSCGESLYQCDYRQLLSRSQANTCLKPALAASVLDLPFANRGAAEKWQLVRISCESENAIDSVAIAATSTRLVILKYDLNMQKFKPVRALDTATPVTSVLYTRHTAIVSSDKFFEIDLDTYAAEEFVDVADQSLSHTATCQPVVAKRISKQEFLLCFMECGVFVDEYGCRSRPSDLNWEYTPTGFLYREPFLYIAHFQSVQVLRLQRSYSKHVQATFVASKDLDADVDSAEPASRRVHLPLYMPTLLANSGTLNAYTLAIQKATGVQEVHHLDALFAFKLTMDGSLETISSIATSITAGSFAST